MVAGDRLKLFGWADDAHENGEKCACQFPGQNQSARHIGILNNIDVSIKGLPGDA